MSVPIYATNTTSQAEYVSTDAGLKLVFVGDQVQYDKVMSFKARTSQLQWVIALDRTAKLSGGGCLYFDDFVRMGAASTRDAFRQVSTKPDQAHRSASRANISAT